MNRAVLGAGVRGAAAEANHAEANLQAADVRRRPFRSGRATVSLLGEELGEEPKPIVSDEGQRWSRAIAAEGTRATRTCRTGSVDAVGRGSRISMGSRDDQAQGARTAARSRTARRGLERTGRADGREAVSRPTLGAQGTEINPGRRARAELVAERRQIVSLGRLRGGMMPKTMASYARRRSPLSTQDGTTCSYIAWDSRRNANQRAAVHSSPAKMSHVRWARMNETGGPPPSM